MNRGTAARLASERRSTTEGFCTECGYNHAPENRQRVLARMLRRFDFGVSATFIREAWPCWYRPGGRALRDDLRAIGAVSSAAKVAPDDHGDDFCTVVWTLPRARSEAA